MRTAALAAIVFVFCREVGRLEGKLDARGVLIVAVIAATLVLIWLVNDRDERKLSASQVQSDASTEAPPR